MRLILSIILVFGLLSGASAQGRYPADDIIYPSAIGREADVALVRFYQQWKRIYLSDRCGDGQYFIDIRGDGKAAYGGSADGTITVSEAHGYGMLITVMMADFDPQAQQIFDGMVAYFKAHPADSSPGLMAWNQVEGCVDAGEDIGGSNSATDGDLDIAYALLLADKRWGSVGRYDYFAEAEIVMNAVLEFELSANGSYLTIGDWVNLEDDQTYVNMTRSSDFMVSHYRAFEIATGDRRWRRLRRGTYTLMLKLAPITGLMPDFITGLPRHPVPAPAGILEGPNDGAYSWNAARYPFRIALDYLLFTEPRAKLAMAPLNVWIVQATGGDPRRIASGYALNGAVLPDAYGNEMAFVSMFAVAAMLNPAGQDWLDALWHDIVAKNLNSEDYFGNTLKMLALLALSGHWQAP
ncbi:MAG: endoglucanase [Rhodobacteraceae bacterium]|nr:endoglucanase [Paracoccaceae bacterium]